MPQPLLSVCIATYNRAPFLPLTLDSLIPQLTPEVEIVVVDGASTDATADVLHRYELTVASLRYVRLGKKGGIDHDFAHAIATAQGEYCWLFSDDDILKPDAIATVLRAIRDKQYGLVVVNGELRSADLTQCYRSMTVAIPEDRTYPAGDVGSDALLADLGSYLSFIGCVVVERELWQGRDSRAYFGTEFVHVGVIFQDALPKPTLFIAIPYVALRMNNSQWSPRGLAIWLVHWPKLIWSFSKRSPWAMARVCPQYAAEQPGKLFLYRAMNTYSLAEYRQVVVPNSPKGGARLIARVIASLPSRVARLVCMLYALVRNRPWIVEDLRRAAVSAKAS